MKAVPYPWNLLSLLLTAKMFLLDLALNGGLCALTVRSDWVYAKPGTDKIPKRMTLGTLFCTLAAWISPWPLLNLAFYALLNLYLLYCGAQLWRNDAKKIALLFWLHASFSLFSVALELYFWGDMVW